MHKSGTLSNPLSTKMAAKTEGEDEEEETLCEFVTQHVNKFFVDHIPVDSIKDLDTTYMYYFGTVAHLLAIFLFVVFTYRNYRSEVNQAFIAMSSSDGSDCQNVPIAVTGQYLADSGGSWIGTPSFVDSKALYSLEFSNFEISSEGQYADMMGTFQRSFDGIGQLAATQNLPENLLFWMSFIQFYYVADPTTRDFAAVGYGQLQSIELTGTPQNVFDLEYVAGAVSGIDGSCPLRSYATFDQANSVLSTVYGNYTQFIADPVCAAAVNPKSFGYVGPLDDNAYAMRLDVRSFATAMAVNYGVLPVSTLKTVNYAPKTFRYLGVEYKIGQYFDVRYRFMETVNCMSNTTAIPAGTAAPMRMCFYVIGETFALPVFNHFGADPVAPVYCDCAEPVGTSQNCQEFNLLSGLVFYKSPPSQIKQDQLTKDLTSFGLYSLLDMMSAFPDYRSFNRAAYNASFIASASSFQPTPGDLSAAYEFCRINGTHTCSLLVFNSFQPTSFEVSDYKYQVFNGSCQDSTSIAPDLWDQLIAAPPVQFTQTYLECYDSVETSFINAVGIASGNVQIFIPVVVLVLLPFLYLFLVVLRQVPPKPEYSNEEQEQALKIFSMLLLRLRDGKTRGIKPRGVLATLTREIISAAKEEGGYPDSDDEEDDDESWQSGQQQKGMNSGGYRAGNHVVSGGGGGGGGGYGGPSGARPSSYSRRPITQLRPSSLNSRDTDVSAAASAMQPSECEGGEYSRQSSVLGRVSGGRSRSTGKTNGSKGTAVSISRPRMAVFTKQIARQREQQERGASVDTGHGDRQSSASAVFRPFASARPSTSERSSAVHNPEHKSSGAVGEPVTAVGAANHHGRRQAGFMGYLYGGSGGEGGDATKDPERGSELVGRPSRASQWHPSSLVDLRLQLVPDGVRVLNAEEESQAAYGGGARRASAANSKKPITGADVDLLVDDMLRLFGEALAHLQRPQQKKQGLQRLSNNGSRNPLHDHDGAEATAVDAVDCSEDREGRPSAAESVQSQSTTATAAEDSFSFAQGKMLSVRLTQVELEELLAREDRTVFLRLSNALCMHASIELGLSMRQVAQEGRGDKIAYNVGGKMLTAAQLERVL